MSKYEEWNNRRAGFDSHAEIVKLQTAKDEDLTNLTKYLQDFTDQLFDFFLEGFSDFFGEASKEESKTIRLISSAEYPPEYVLQRILQQASFDLTVIQRINEQRKDKALRSDLEKYDQLALLALSIAFPDPANRDTWLIDPVKPFVYFQRETSVRIIPYANALLIGVPYSAKDQPIDLLSIPHEIGHHIYETGRFSETERINLFFEKYFAYQPAWIRNWLEEIFADLYGFLVAGPIVGFSLQEILLDNFPGSLAEDDGDHPAGIIRPLTYSQLFKSNRFNGGSGAHKTALELEERWQNEGRKRGFANTFKPVTENNVIDKTEASNTLSSVLRDMNEQINNKTDGAFDFPASLNPKDNLQPWTFFPNGETSNSTDGQIKFEEPLAQFNVDRVISERQAQVDKMTKLLRPSDFKLSRKAQNEYWLTGQIGYWDKQKQEGDLPALVPNIWKLIFTAFSWADKPADDTRPVKGPENIHY